jgi:Kef-type K+ transport system membrane component KefB
MIQIATGLEVSIAPFPGVRTRHPVVARVELVVAFVAGLAIVIAADR